MFCVSKGNHILVDFTAGSVGSVECRVAAGKGFFYFPWDQWTYSDILENRVPFTPVQGSLCRPADYTPVHCCHMQSLNKAETQLFILYVVGVFKLGKLLFNMVEGPLTKVSLYIIWMSDRKQIV